MSTQIAELQQKELTKIQTEGLPEDILVNLNELASVSGINIETLAREHIQLFLTPKYLEAPVFQNRHDLHEFIYTALKKKHRKMPNITEIPAIPLYASRILESLKAKNFRHFVSLIKNPEEEWKLQYFYLDENTCQIPDKLQMKNQYSIRLTKVGNNGAIKIDEGTIWNNPQSLPEDLASLLFKAGVPLIKINQVPSFVSEYRNNYPVLTSLRCIKATVGKYIKYTYQDTTSARYMLEDETTPAEAEV